MKKLLAIFIVVILAVILVASCAKPAPAPAPSPAPAPKPAPPPPPAPPSPKYGGTFKEVAVSVPDIVGWPAGLTGASTETPQVVFDPFLRADNKGGYHPWLAESYKLADDLMSITFKLRKDVKFHDGSMLNAAVAKWNIDNQIEAKMVPYWKSVDVLDNYI